MGLIYLYLYKVQYTFWLLNIATYNTQHLRHKGGFYWHRTNTFHLKVMLLADCQFAALAKTLTPYRHLEEMDCKEWRRKLKGGQLKDRL
jgi:hypothetical protein